MGMYSPGGGGTAASKRDPKNWKPGSNVLMFLRLFQREEPEISQPLPGAATTGLQKETQKKKKKVKGS